MCGIGAIFGKDIGERKFSIMRSLETVKHRGFSNYEIAIFENAVLGANRLQIIDRENAKQPQSNESGSIHAILNGEIFNYIQLRSELIEMGHRFNTNSDTEVLVHLWEEYGEQMVKKIDSEMFAFIIYDKNKDNFFVARDPYGVKPLYYAKDKKENFHFASEIKQLSQFKEIDIIEQFPQGCYMISGKIKKYHKISNEETEDDLEIMIGNIRNLFDESVKKRVKTDLPIGVFLSGGLDSTAVLITALEYHKDVTAITVGLEGSNDLEISKRYCAEKGIKLITLNPPTEEKLLEIIPQIINITESFEPNMIRQGTISFYISKIAKDLGLKIILVGEGPDELFAGYPEFSNSNEESIKNRILSFVNDLPRTQFQRVDRTTMNFTIEARVPFFDTKLADYVLKIPSRFKIRKEKGRIVTKWILREAMRDRLPSYICDREKEVLSEGAGYKGNQTIGGLFYQLIKEKITDKEFEKLNEDYPEWNIHNKEVAFYFKIFKKLLFTKAKFNQVRPISNSINSINIFN